MRIHVPKRPIEHCLYTGFFLAELTSVEADMLDTWAMPTTSASDLHLKLISLPEDPEFLFRYTNFESLRMLLERATLWFSPFSKMNDPRETQEWYRHAGAAVDDILRKTTCIACFTVDIPGNHEDFGSNHHHGWARPRMWDQYASQKRMHVGACLVIDFRLLCRHLDELFRVSPSDPTRTDPVDGLLGEGNMHIRGFVRYSNSAPIPLAIPPHRNPSELQQLLGDPDVFTRDHMRDLYMTKNTDWESEHEFRIVFRCPEAYPDRLDRGLSFKLGDYLRGIVLGRDYEDMESDEIREHLANAGLSDVQIFRCRWEAGQPSLEALP